MTGKRLEFDDDPVLDSPAPPTSAPAVASRSRRSFQPGEFEVELKRIETGSNRRTGIFLVFEMLVLASTSDELPIGVEVSYVIVLGGIAAFVGETVLNEIEVAFGNKDVSGCVERARRMAGVEYIPAPPVEVSARARVSCYSAKTRRGHEINRVLFRVAK